MGSKSMKLDIRQGFLYLIVMGMEGCWLYALLFWLNEQAASGSLSIIGLLFIYPIAFILTKLLSLPRWPKTYFNAANWLMWLVVVLLVVKLQLFSEFEWSDTTWLLALPRAITQILFTFKPELFILLSSFPLWWLGRRLAHLKISFAATVGEFQLGLLVLLSSLFIMSLLEITAAGQVFVVLTFVMLALLGMSLTHTRGHSSQLTQLWGGHWLGLLILSLSLILVFGLAITFVVPGFLQLIVTALKWGWWLIETLVDFIASLFPPPESAELTPPQIMPVPPELLEPSDGGNMFTLPDAVRSALRLGYTIFVIIFLTVIFWRISQQVFEWLRLRLRLIGRTGAEVESIPNAFRIDLLGFLKRILSVLLLFRIPSWLRRKSGSALPEVDSVRRVYRQLLRWAAAAGYPKEISQTANEYLYTLADLLPQSKEDLGFITRQYVSARYGPSLPTENELHGIKQSWHRLRQNHLKRKKR